MEISCIIAISVILLVLVLNAFYASYRLNAINKCVRVLAKKTFIPPKDKEEDARDVIYPPGAKWCGGILFSVEGACIAEVDNDGSAFYCHPFRRIGYITPKNLPSFEAAKQWVVEQLAKREYFGFKKAGKQP
jgi:hypothetical protein